MKSILAAALAIGTLGANMGVAFAADLAEETPVMTAPSVTSASYYVGGNFGYGTGFADHHGSPPGFPNGDDLNLAGWLLGGQVGATFKLSDNIVGGVQADLDWSNISGSGFFCGNGTITETINWTGTVEGRLGLETGGLMPYLAGGLAFANATRTWTGFGGGSANVTHMGWSLGAGVVVQVADNTNLDFEYRYQSFGAMTYPNGTPNSPSVSLTTNQVRVGLNWSF